MRRVAFGCIAAGLAASCLGQTLCPTHIETPVYPAPALIAHIQGTVTVTVTIEADGQVKNVVVADKPGHQAQAVLQQSAVDNMRHWTFEKPPSAPFIQVMVYRYEFDSSLKPDANNHPGTKVNFDLPDRVTLLFGSTVINPEQSKKGKPSSHTATGAKAPFF
jgi:TonB family protein